MREPLTIVESATTLAPLFPAVNFFTAHHFEIRVPLGQPDGVNFDCFW